MTCLATPCLAQQPDDAAAPGVGRILEAFEIRGFGDLRLRYENAEDDARAAPGRAATARLRSGFEIAPDPRLAILAEFEGSLTLAGAYDDLINGDTRRAVIPDPEFIELNRASLRVEPWRDVSVTIGRQYLTFDDERFVGKVAFRQNDQTYDAAKFSASFANGVGFDAVYLRRTNRILSGRNAEGRFWGDSYLLNASVPLPLGRVVGFHYALDLASGENGAINQNASSQTTGLRYEGRAAWPGESEENPSLKWEGSYARQRDFAGAPAAFGANYWLGAMTVDSGNLSVGARIEILGSDENAAFQTPLGTLHAFQGEADIFTVTPDDGVRERSAFVEWRAGTVGPFHRVKLSLSGLSFRSASGNASYGKEIDATIRARIEGAALSITLADYSADGFAADARRVWVTVERSF